MMNTPADIKGLALKTYERHQKTWARQEDPPETWPWSITLSPPSQKEVVSHWAEVKAWADAWSRYSGPGRVEYEEKNWKVASKQTIPVKIWYDSVEALAQEADKMQAWKTGIQRLERMYATWPQLKGQAFLIDNFPYWSTVNPAEFNRIVNLLKWLEANPLSGAYIRELPIPGVDTKWLEKNEVFVTSMLKCMGACRPDAENLYEAFNLKRRPKRLRIRLLDKADRAKFGNLSDIELSVQEANEADLSPQRILLIENVETGLALPDMKGTVAIFGMGNAIGAIEHVSWIQKSPIVLYWGDLDVAGFGILEEAKKKCPKVQSALMDKQTWDLHHAQNLCGRQATQKKSINGYYLTQDEKEMADFLFSQTKEDRLEQERVGWALALKTLSERLGIRLDS